MSFVSAIILSCMVTAADASLYDFIYIGECVLGYNPFVLLLKHGCYCGFGNFGDNVTAEDGYDKCCKAHDDCYGNLVNKTHECRSTLQEYLSPYTVRCHKRCTATCHVPFPFSLFPSVVNCSMGLCRCDIQMMECWRKVQWSNEKNGSRPDKRICRNGGEKPPTGIQEKGTWLENLFLYMEFKSNMPWIEYLNSNRTNLSLLPESKCKEYANETTGESNDILFGAYSKKTNDVYSNHIPRHPDRTDVRGNVFDNELEHVVPFV
ncbi:unnamed protein product [Cylicocyclus nassatus]|uniref:Phospholipase A2-like central domain-containing protein n=1 Tax=Cylicocyclus nassatus TaxID=53992 RepID=A0AA36H7B0_CYLNA|nr:unnamed protein product [Cylicocyclus nassatus]